MKPIGLRNSLFCLFFTTTVFVNSQISPSSHQNYILEVDYLSENGTSGDKRVAIQYFDGLGRPLQSVLVQASPSGKDIVVPIEYDGFGRQTKEYLPVPTSQSTGSFITPSSINGNYYQSTFGQSVWYSEKELENSSLNRVLKQAAPGDSWALGSGHEISFHYQSNKASEVKNYRLNVLDYELIDAGYYPIGSLYKVKTVDENGNSIEEFKDKLGRVILKRSYVEETALAGKGFPSILNRVDTYYVYDVYGNLVAVVPPLASEKSVLNSVLQTNLCYFYRYDTQNRLVEKKLPGKDWEYMVYDKQNRLVATQDANLRVQGKWLFTKYDKFGRVVYTGIYNSGASRTSLQATVNGLGNNSEERMTSSQFTLNGQQVHYTRNKAFPVNNTNSELLTVNYYDNWGNINKNGAPAPTITSVLKGLPVATSIRIIGTPNWEHIYTYYDEKARPFKTYKKNHLGGFTQTESELDFRGKPIFSETIHKRNASGVEVITKDFFEYDNRERLVKHSQSINNSTTKNLIAQNKYDRRGQLISKKVGGTQTNAADRWQEVRYNYNIRGWLTYINNPMELVAGENTIPPAPNDDLFAFNIRYTNPTNDGESLYNGNISQTIWKTASDNTQRGYNYTYDRLNRLRRADFYKQGAGNLTAYGEFISYDVNGNITHLTRTTGDASDNDIDMDDLSYTYDKDGLSNLLVNVADAVTTGSSEGFKDGNTDPNLDDYEYDANGNMIKDRNKGISNITYNHLNLPTQIEFEGTTNKITYLYNAAGQKLKKTVVYSDSIKIVDYLDGFQYAGGELNFFPHPEGYVSVKRGGRTAPDGSQGYVFNYVFNYTDHLGNVRVSYSKDPQTQQLKILEENHYYPFGLRHSVYAAGRLRDFEVDSSNPEGEHVFLNNVTKTEYQYKYNSFEYQDELGLNWYDYMARNYDPALGRWMNMDPLAEISRRHSPYTYVYNNPLRFIDPDGMAADDVIIRGDLADKAFTQLESETSLSLTHDKTSGKVETNDLSRKEYRSLSKGDRKLYDAIKDSGKTVKLTATSANEINVDGVDKILVLGAYEGSTLSSDGESLIGEQYVNPDQAEKVEANGGNTAGEIVKHEILESYVAMGIGKGVHNVETEKGVKVYHRAHKKTMKLDKKICDNCMKVDRGKSIPGHNLYFTTNPNTGVNAEIFRVKQ